MPNKIDTKKLCREAGRTPFDELNFRNHQTKCPFHNGDTDTSMSIKQGDDGVWRVTCHSECRKTWDPIAYVMQRRNVQFLDALKILGGKTHGNEERPNNLPPQTVAPKVKPKAMTWNEWNSYGRELTPEDIARLAKSRKDTTANFETYKSLGCRVKDDWLAFPHYRTIYDPDSSETDVEFYTIKLRHLDDKQFDQEHCASSKGFFNLDTVNAVEDVYVVEGEPDVAIMEQHGFRAVSPTSGSQRKFSKEALKIIAMAPRCFLVGDQGEDDPGQACMDELQRQELLLPEKTFRVRFEHAHDVCQLARKTGNNFASHIAQLRDDSLEPWVTSNIPSISQLTHEPMKWVVDRMVPYGCVTMLSGSKGSMKSLLAMDIAQRISSTSLHSLGPVRPVFGRAFMRGIPVLYIDRENPEAMVTDRATKRGILANRDFQYWVDRHKGEPTPELDDPRLMEFARRKNGLIVLDSFQDWYGDENENDNSAMAKLMRKVQRLARAGAGVLVLHHLNADGTRARGGTTITSLTDFAILVRKSDEDSNVIELREDRFRMCEKWEMDIRAHWNAGAFHNYEEFHQFEVLRDQLMSDVIQGKRQEDKAAEAADRVKVAEALKNYPDNAPSTIAGKIGMDRKKFQRLVKDLERDAVAVGEAAF